jgi:HSP20 family protein
MKQPRRQPSIAIIRAPGVEKPKHHPSATAESKAQPKLTSREPQSTHSMTNTRPVSAPTIQKPNSSAPETMTKKRAFTPRFDIYETDSAYQLIGSLPGLRDKKSINIDFSSGQEGDIVTISGRIERESEKNVEVENENENEIKLESTVEETTENEDGEKPSDIPSETPYHSDTSDRSLQPYVEDTDDECDPVTPSSRASLRSRRSSTSSTRSTASSSSRSAGDLVRYSQPEKTEKTKTEEDKLKSQVNHYPRTLVSERSFGEFSRNFKFPSPVLVEDVKARLEDGLLEIFVPKKRFMGRRIVIE